ncbi:MULTISPECIES: anti-sigma factor [Anaeromyxobacter]|uniref:anti-sigma factor family protein n=1 Tax=Anaeromyxobacter TaxID=161492 RepID=UPI001F55D53C|nr:MULTISPECIES: anti-sigma factor [unclassified Anaeromyxobacter]
MTIENEKVIAGLSCSDVLARLSDYVDGDLPAEERGRVEDHLRACEGCARFGGEFAATVRGLRTHLGAPASVSGELKDRLRRALDDDGAP